MNYAIQDAGNEIGCYLRAISRAFKSHIQEQPLEYSDKVSLFIYPVSQLYFLHYKIFNFFWLLLYRKKKKT